MRFASRLGSSILLLLLIGFAPAADAPPDVRTVVVPQAQVWCGPSTSDGLYPTNRLRQGERVQVVEELPSGWLAIRPPAGSFSWINKRFVQQVAAKYTNYVVAYEGFPAPVFIGSSERKDRPTVTGVKLPRGAQVHGIANGRTMTDDEGTWLPIEPPDGEVRYIRKEEVARPQAPTLTTAAVVSSARPSAAPLPPPDGDALWRDAEKAEATGRVADAIRLFQLAGEANLTVNPARSDAAYQRAHWLQQANSTSNTPGGSYYYPERDPRSGQVYPLPTDRAGTNAVHLIAPGGSGPPPGQLVSSQAASPAGGSQTANGCQTATGHLIAARQIPDYSRCYLLLNEHGTPLMHVVAGPGVDLTSHLDRNVEVSGRIVYRSDMHLRGSLMITSQVRSMP